MDVRYIQALAKQVLTQLIKPIAARQISLYLLELKRGATVATANIIYG